MRRGNPKEVNVSFPFRFLSSYIRVDILGTKEVNVVVVVVDLINVGFTQR